jgi:ketosteroid isomerase-like protein
VAQLTNEECVARYAAASAAYDLPALAALRHPDWMTFWPQSGERVHGNEAWAEIIANYPGGAPKTEVTRIVGAEDQWVVTAGNTVLKVAGSGGVAAHVSLRGGLPRRRPDGAARRPRAPRNLLLGRALRGARLARPLGAAELSRA